MKKRFLSFALILCITVNLSGIFAGIAAAETNDSCGDNLTWTVSDGTLTITGNGAMQDYQSEQDVPWYSVRSDITDIVMPEGMTAISDYAFSNCHRVESISIPESVITIGNNAFYYCYSLTDIDIPDTAESIGNMAFAKCSNLTGVTIGSGLENIGAKVFSSCDALTTISVSEDNSIFSSSDGVLMSKDKTKLIVYPCGKAGGYTIPDSVVSIADNAFYYCKKLSSVTFSGTVADIGDSAFYYCKKLADITLPDSVEKIGNNAFASCINLENISIGKGVSEIGNDAFISCNSLSGISVSEDNTVYSSSDGVLLDKEQSTLLKCPPAKTGKYEIPDSVRTIADNAFIYCIGLDSIDMPENLEIIENSAFCYCIALSELSLPANVTTISESAFYNCNNISTVYMPVSVTDIYDSAFSGCNSIKRIYYGGNESQWNAISVKENNKPLTDAEIYFECFDGENIVVSGVTVTPRSASLLIGETIQLSAECLPDEAVDKSVVWTSSSPDIASVDENGLVTAIADGEATITATSANGKNAICNVVVKKNYINYSYNFSNNRNNFGYKNGYMIPMERYLQLGFSSTVANSLLETWGGSCFGMSTSSAMFYKNIIHEERYNENIHMTINFDKPDSSTDLKEIKLRNMIELMQISFSLLPSHKDFSADEIAAELDNGNPVVIYLLKGNRTSAHAVVIYDYTQTGDVYDFDIYDCSNYVTALSYTDSDNWSFTYTMPAFESLIAWIPLYYYTMDDIDSVYKRIYNANNFGAASLFSQSEQKTYILFPAGDMSVTNSLGQTSTVTDGILSGDIDNVTILYDEYSEEYTNENPKYTLIVPTDTYTISGVGENIVQTVFVNDNIAVTVTSESATPITVSADLCEVSIANTNTSDYSVLYTTYGNIFDEMTLSGTSDTTVTTTLDASSASVEGADSVNATVSVGANIVSANAEAVSDYTSVDVKCSESDNTLQILADDEALTEKSELPERERTSLPAYEIATDEVSGKQILSFTKDDDTVIYYTTDSSEPTRSSTLYTMPIEINDSITVKAIVSKCGYTDSEPLVINEKEVYIAPPTANYESGRYNDVIYLELSAEEEVTEIRYAMNEEDLYENDILYTVPLKLTEDTVIYAYSAKDGYTSEIKTFEYKITLKYPVRISDTIKNQNGEAITPENTGNLTQIKLDVEKLCSDKQSAVFIVAFYDESGYIVSLGTESTVLESDLQTVTVNITGNNENISTMKVLIWDSLFNLKPVGEAVIQNITAENI